MTAETARLHARPDSAAATGSAPAAIEPGLHELGLAQGRDGLLYVPHPRDSATPAPLVVLLHGAGSTARRGIDLLLPVAEEAGLVLLAPDARRATWDVITGGYGPDVAFIDEALASVFQRVAIDPAAIAVGGFSDGASYALSIGIPNGDLFGAIVAFSPGFAVPPSRTGSPRVFVTHGVDDRVLPIDRCSRLLVPALREAGYDVEYREFDGGHVVPPELAREAAAWLVAAGDPAPDGEVPGR
jgi:phospholipase/carboxylesterase